MSAFLRRDTRRQSVRAALGVSLFCAALAPAGFARDDDWQRVYDVLEQQQNEARTRAEVVTELAELPFASTGPLFELWAGEGLERMLDDTRAELGEDVALESLWWGGQPDRLGELALSALSQRDPRRVVEWIQRRLESAPPLTERLGALALLRELGSARGIEPIFAIAHSLDGIELRYRGVRRELFEALTAVLAEDPYALEELADPLRGLSLDLTELVVEALGAAACPGSTRLLLDLLGRDEEIDSAILAAVTAIQVEQPWRAIADPLPTIRDLAEHPDWRLRRDALVALAKMHDADSIPIFVAALHDAHDRVGRTAQWCLGVLSDSDVPRTPERWIRSYEETRAALDQEFAERGEWRDLDRADALDAIRRLSQRPLMKHAAAVDLARALEHPDPEVALAACEALGRLASRRAVPALVEALGASDLRLRDTAWRALVALTGQDLPPKPAAWADFLGR